MNKITVTVEREVEIKFLFAKVGVRYWEDSIVDGKEDIDGTLMPCRNRGYWNPIISISTGIIQNWVKGKTARVHYKVCDDGLYQLLDPYGFVILEINGHVPGTMCPKDNGYGDYIIMDIDSDGKIDKWNFDKMEFAKKQPTTNKG